ncbi:histidine phosphatase family protein [Mycetocola reblochoni]|uniref:Phosphoglycerate mutase n=2 Tax=Mycetocola reblochoni TaxID=331618 RepID=A0A1R4J5Q4_9MICO|nr:histidine phosphatase family protein [Mycetocola reblochoni]RLP69579.1 histidine phosphatase family protein [Mycetocola reblochoni]SJN27339.1 Phosphoglycerate mutase [Mycetocola reblochoni REB411]
MTSFTLVRHGETEWNRQGRIQGQTDIPLNDTGRAQAVRAAEALAGSEWHAVVSSGLSRADETASIMAERLGIDGPVAVPGLRERAHGELEGLTVEERRARFEADEAVPGLESREAVVERTLDALGALAADFPASRVLVVTHGGLIGSLVRHLSRDESVWDGRLIPNGSAYELSWDERGPQLVSAAGAPWRETDRAPLAEPRV